MNKKEYRERKVEEERQYGLMGEQYDKEQEQQRKRITKEKLGKDYEGLITSEVDGEYKMHYDEWEKHKKDGEERKKRINRQKQQLDDLLSRYGQVFMPSEIRDTVEHIIGYDYQKEKLKDFFDALKNFMEFSEELYKVNMIPTFSALLYGASGTGKTHLTRAFSKKYNIPICIIECGRMISSLLGDTLKNITKVLDNSSDLAKEFGAFVIFFDEIDALGGERSQERDVGEIKRATITFLQMIDRIMYEGIPLAIFGATNHEQNLDSALWRRFSLHLQFDFPNFLVRKGIIELFVNKIKKTSIKVDKLIFEKLQEEFQLINSIAKNKKINEFKKGFWKIVKERGNKKKAGLLEITVGYSGSDVERGTKVALYKAIGLRRLDYKIFYDSMKSVGGTQVHFIKNKINRKSN